jgi:hypothetical protein
MSPVDPLRLLKIASKYPDDHDIASAWKDVEIDIWDIARIPSYSPQITRLSKILGFLKQLLMFIGLIILVVYIIGSYSRAFDFMGKYEALGFAVIFVLAYTIGFGSYYLLDRRLTRLVGLWYDKNSSKISRQRKHVKQINQRLIDKIAAEIRKNKVDPAKYWFTLMQTDYNNIVVRKEKSGSTFTVSVKGSKMVD